MDSKQDKFMQELLADFKVEAAEHLTLFTNGLLELEKGVAPEVAQKIVEDIFREIHSAKGAARAVNLSEIERVCQSLESALASLKAGRIEVSPALLDTLHDAGDLLSTMLSDLNKGTRVVKGEDAMAMVFLLTDVAQGKIPMARAARKRATAIDSGAPSRFRQNRTLLPYPFNHPFHLSRPMMPALPLTPSGFRSKSSGR